MTRHCPFPFTTGRLASNQVLFYRRKIIKWQGQQIHLKAIEMRATENKWCGVQICTRLSVVFYTSNSVWSVCIGPTSLHVLLLWTKFRAAFSFKRRCQFFLNILARRSAMASLSIGAVANCIVALLVGHALGPHACRPSPSLLFSLNWKRLCKGNADELAGWSAASMGSSSRVPSVVRLFELGCWGIELAAATRRREGGIFAVPTAACGNASPSVRLKTAMLMHMEGSCWQAGRHRSQWSCTQSIAAHLTSCFAGNVSCSGDVCKPCGAGSSHSAWSGAGIGRSLLVKPHCVASSNSEAPSRSQPPSLAGLCVGQAQV